MPEVRRYEVLSPDGIGEVRPGDDLAALVTAAVDLREGDVLVVTSKIVSKAEGRVRAGDRDSALAEETVRVVARRGPTTIVRNRLGLTMAAAGIDASNVEAGRIVLLPLDPDASARALREALADRTGCNVGVVITDTAGRAWRDGQTDIAVGAAGVLVAESFAGAVDEHGNELAVTLPAVADEIASAAELAQGKLGGRPVAVLRGRADLVLPAGEHGAGAVSLVRPEGADLFGLGAREAVLRALLGHPDDAVVFGAPVPAEELASVLGSLLGTGEGTGVALVGPGPEHRADLPAGTDRTAVTAVLFAHGWQVTSWTPSPGGGGTTDAESAIRLTLSPRLP